MGKYIPKTGDYVKPDRWIAGNNLEAGETINNWACQFRLPSRHYAMAVNITVTGKPIFIPNHYGNISHKSRVKIEFVGDSEPSTLCGGYIFHTI